MRRMPRIRLLPVMIFLAVLMLSVRLGAVWDGVERLRTVQVGQSSALAQAGASPAAPAPPASAPASASASAASAAAPPPSSASPSASPMAASGDLPPGSAMPAGDAMPMGGLRGDSPAAFTQSEIDLLQRLSERRAQLEAQAREMDQREAMLKAAEGRIDRKIGEMKSLESSIQALLKERDAQEQARLDMLVNIYKTMKPKEAAVIFNDMELPLIVDIFMLMKERSSSAILASMDPGRAREVTSELARKRMPLEAAQTPQGPQG